MCQRLQTVRALGDAPTGRGEPGESQPLGHNPISSLASYLWLHPHLEVKYSQPFLHLIQVQLSLDLAKSL